MPICYPLIAWVISLLWQPTALGIQQAPLSNPRDPAGTAIIAGAVVNDETGELLAGVRVTRWVDSNFQHEVITDDQGRFLFRSVGPGAYHLVAEVPGYAQAAFGRRRAGGAERLVSVVDGQRMTGVVLRVFPANSGRIGGTVLDQVGEPAVGITVALVPKQNGMGGGHAIYGYPSTTQTDDQGRYQFAVAAGDYFVAVPPATTLTVNAHEALHPDRQAPGQTPGARPLVYVPAQPPIVSGDLRLFVGDPTRVALTPQLSATGVSTVYAIATAPAGMIDGEPATVSVARGDTRVLDFSLKLQPAGIVRGRLRGPDGPVANVPVRLLPPFAVQFATGSGIGFDIAQAITDDQGRFQFTGVPAGQFEIDVQVAPEFRPSTDPSPTVGVGGKTITMTASAYVPPDQPQAGPTWYASQLLATDGRDVSDVTLDLTRGAEVTGHLVFDSLTPPSPQTIARLSVSLHPVDRTPLRALTPHCTPDGHFQTAGVPAGLYELTVFPQSWVVRSAMYCGRDLFAEPFAMDTTALDDLVVTVTDKVATIAGGVRDGRGLGDGDATVLVFPNRYHVIAGLGGPPQGFKEARASEDGRFSVTGLLAGDYLIIAIDDQAAANWRSPAALAALSAAATHVTLADNEHRSVDLKTAVVRW